MWARLEIKGGVDISWASINNLVVKLILRLYWALSDLISYHYASHILAFIMSLLESTIMIIISVYLGIIFLKCFIALYWRHWQLLSLQLILYLGKTAMEVKWHTTHVIVWDRFVIHISLRHRSWSLLTLHHLLWVKVSHSTISCMSLRNGHVSLHFIRSSWSSASCLFTHTVLCFQELIVLRHI